MPIRRETFAMVLAVSILTSCGVPDASLAPDAQTIPHEDVDTIPEAIRNGEAGFTGVIVFGDRGYTGLSGNTHYPNIRINGSPIGKCEKRRAMVVPLAPGRHVVSAHSEHGVEQVAILQEGSVAYFRCNFFRIGGLIFAPPVLDTSDAAEAYEIVNR